jgi:hypothetical protein
MIDGNSYRLAESLAKRHISDWHIVQFHNVVFDSGAFPNNIDSYSELAPILDTMQENRFSNYMREMNGLTDNECHLLVDNLCDCILFQRTFMPDIRTRLPYATMIAHLAAFSKITTYNPEFNNILEIGPGCGYLPFFLRHHTPLKNYSHTEACEGFYILQSIINSYIFKHKFEDRAFPKGQEDAESIYTNNSLFFDDFDYIDIPFDPISIHYPWWRLNEIHSHPEKFDIVMSNANLKEFMPEALDDYLSLTKDCLTDEGVLFCQCLGGPLRTKDELLQKKLFENGFAPLIYLESPGAVIAEIPQLSQKIEKHFTVSQGLFIKDTHSLFNTYYKQENYSQKFIAGELSVLKMLFGPSGIRNFYSQEDIFNLVKSRLAEKLTT